MLLPAADIGSSASSSHSSPAGGSYDFSTALSSSFHTAWKDQVPTYIQEINGDAAANDESLEDAGSLMDEDDAKIAFECRTLTPTQRSVFTTIFIADFYRLEDDNEIFDILYRSRNLGRFALTNKFAMNSLMRT
jgi:hypothetical protein